jgi:hypothetical protein
MIKRNAEAELVKLSMQVQHIKKEAMALKFIPGIVLTK